MEIAVIPDELMLMVAQGEISWNEAARRTVVTATTEPLLDSEDAKDWRAVLSMKGAQE